MYVRRTKEAQRICRKDYFKKNLIFFKYSRILYSGYKSNSPGNTNGAHSLFRKILLFLFKCFFYLTIQMMSHVYYLY